MNRFNSFVVGDSYVKEAARLHPKSRDEIRRRDNTFCLADRVHESEYSQLKSPPEPAHQLVVTLEPNEFTSEKYEVYGNYQTVVHKDLPQDITPQAFKRFLCSSPLRREVMNTEDGQERILGSYHQCYRLDGKLVAIGVLDLLPECVSSVYFLYHESIHKHAPGKLSALREIALAAEQGYRWWYPGFYIHNCPKMRYKNDYSPQHILDPESLAWLHLDSRVLRLLDQRPFLSLTTAEPESTLEGAIDDGEADVRDAKRPKIDGEAQVTRQQGGSSQVANQEGMRHEEDENDGGVADSLFNTRMPGIVSIAEMMEVDLDHIALRLSRNRPLYKTSDLVGWESKRVTDWPGIKASIAELVAAVGPEVSRSICIDMARGE